MSLLKNRYTSAFHNFIQSFQYKEHLPLVNSWKTSIVQKNRLNETKIPIWWDEELLNDSIFQYGIVDDIKPFLNKPLGNTYNYSDLLCHFHDLIKHNDNKRINYLELGVSVGKNLFTLLNYFDNADLYGYEIEEINPYLSNHLVFENKVEWQTSATSLKRHPSSLSNYSFSTNKLHYLSGDIWDQASWEKLSGKKFDIIFSDAFHSPDALLFEYEMLVKYNLIGEQFILVWDDLHFGMKDAFLTINMKIKKSNHLMNTKCFLIQINGWLGENWGKHPVGIITNIF